MEFNAFIRALGQLSSEDLITNYIEARTGDHKSIDKIPVAILQDASEALEALDQCLRDIAAAKLISDSSED